MVHCHHPYSLLNAVGTGLAHEYEAYLRSILRRVDDPLTSLVEGRV